MLAWIVFKERIYKIWKQFTTKVQCQPISVLLCSKNEYTKSESNSQLVMSLNIALKDCVQRTNIQNLKAIHNSRKAEARCTGIVFKERIYKIWKQFTTYPHAYYPPRHCVQRTNIQNLKAIHNFRSMTAERNSIVFKERIYKIWKQFTTLHSFERCGVYCVQRTNIQNLKAIHNEEGNVTNTTCIVFKERIYKIWKQFTTHIQIFVECGLLCSKNEYTKSESNSQHLALIPKR